MNALVSETLLAEYKGIMGALDHDATDEQIVGALIAHAEWTERGGREVLHLARQHGTSVLRNALALAKAMGIEDGNGGL